jgi:hypothetical protein
VSDAAADWPAPPAADLARAALALARRSAAGATLWCLAPEWPEHARHVAVEFVHPVVLGKRALPAASAPAGDPVAGLRAAARAGDVLLAVAPSTSATTLDALRRAAAWGLTTMWLGAGPRPPAAAADHVVWFGDDGAVARHDGRLVLGYHVLWELTHVCLEHPGLLRDVDAPCAADDPSCATCRDEARPVEVTSLLTGGLVVVRSARGVEEVDASLIGEPAPGDLLLVHAGTAIERLEPAGG